MSAFSKRRCAGRLVTVVLAMAATTAAAQSPGMDDATGSGRRQHRGEGSAVQPQKKPPLPAMKITPEPWPRLDPGAVFCRTAEDLHQHLAIVAARLDGNARLPGEPPGCRLIRARTAVTVVLREGPAQTQVRMSETPAETGWTDAFLPEKKPGP